MELIGDYGLFLAKALTIVVACMLLAGALVNLGRDARKSSSGLRGLEIRHLNAEFEQAALELKSAMLSRRGSKAARKASKARMKQVQRDQLRHLFVLDFEGDLQASAVEALREEITAVLTTARPGDEVLLRLHSAGGLVHAYGLAAAQLMRLGNRNLKLTVAVDKVAASGGYMMACVADRILAAPFAVIGSIGVIAQLPNFNRLLKNHDIDFEQFMAGEHKRTVTVFGENTDQGRAKFQQEIEQAHALFKSFIAQHRPAVDLQRLATGEHWYGSQALELGLADELLTSDEYLLKASEDAQIYQISCARPQPWLNRLINRASANLPGIR
jgi:serine protease SohB